MKFLVQGGGSGGGVFFFGQHESCFQLVKSGGSLDGEGVVLGLPPHFPDFASTKKMSSSSSSISSLPAYGNKR